MSDRNCLERLDPASSRKSVFSSSSQTKMERMVAGANALEWCRREGSQAITVVENTIRDVLAGKGDGGVDEGNQGSKRSAANATKKGESCDWSFFVVEYVSFLSQRDASATQCFLEYLVGVVTAPTEPNKHVELARKAFSGVLYRASADTAVPTPRTTSTWSGLMQAAPHILEMLVNFMAKNPQNPAQSVSSVVGGGLTAETAVKLFLTPLVTVVARVEDANGITNWVKRLWQLVQALAAVSNGKEMNGSSAVLCIILRELPDTAVILYQDPAFYELCMTFFLHSDLVLHKRSAYCVAQASRHLQLPQGHWLNSFLSCYHQLEGGATSLHLVNQIRPLLLSLSEQCSGATSQEQNDDDPTTAAYEAPSSRPDFGWIRALLECMLAPTLPSIKKAALRLIMAPTFPIPLTLEAFEWCASGLLQAASAKSNFPVLSGGLSTTSWREGLVIGVGDPSDVCAWQMSPEGCAAVDGFDSMALPDEQPIPPLVVAEIPNSGPGQS